MPTFREKGIQAWGKIRRFLYVSFARGEVRRKLDLRRGACTRCGACCKLLFRCPAYDETGGQPKCLIYNDRPGVCGLFPLDEADLRDRNIVMPEVSCGFYFAEAAAPSRNGRRQVSMPARWKASSDDAANAVSPKPRFLRSALAMLRFQWNRKRRGVPVPIATDGTQQPAAVPARVRFQPEHRNSHSNGSGASKSLLSPESFSSSEEIGPSVD